MDLTWWQWAALASGSFLIGATKAGIVGIGILAIAIFALILPPRESTGVVLPLLICADAVAVALYRRHAVWPHLIRLVPWAALGIVVGALAMSRIDDRAVQLFLGAVLLALTLYQLGQRLRPLASENETSEAVTEHSASAGLAAVVGLAAGVATMLSNAAGPLMVLYLLAMRLPKWELIGTGAWYFLLLNVWKVPFSAGLGLMNASTLLLDLTLAPFAIAGVLLGRRLIALISQNAFELIALIFTGLAAVRLLWMG
ncbi:MAG: sulfite exporter TauE/SafE family protein [Armatimonadetes bacterium]|nr:sulfite exporter TauE/SafE family protein [Armatimonadota bacterium]